METLLLFLLLLAAVLASAVLDQIIPHVSLPLVQIGIGVVIAIFATDQVNIKLDPELFLVLFIAPLLYDEAKSADNARLWSLKRPVLSLAIGLVVATTLCIGFAVHALIPSIPLAAAFALGAALGPTDAVAVSSLSKTVAIPERQKGILQGELLLNDASGIVSFQFAIAAVTTGAFSLAGASVAFLLEFVGGLIAGALFALGSKWLLHRAQRLGVDNTTFHVMFEIFTPFIIYLTCASIHVSGIIAVVVAGLMNVADTRDAGPQTSKMNIISSSMWKIISTTLNGIVFVLLGTQLPRAMQHTWDDVALNNLFLILYVLLITAILMLVRFIWIAAMEHMHHKRNGDSCGMKDIWRPSLISTFSGAKGTITLSIMFSMPFYMSTYPYDPFPQRDLLIFLACGVILCTLLIATFLVPVIAPKPATPDKEKSEREVKLIVEMLREVMSELTTMQTPENRLAVERAIQSYNARINKLVDTHNLEDPPESPMKIKAIHWQRERVEELAEAGEVNLDVARRYLNRLDSSESLIQEPRLGEKINNNLMQGRLLYRYVKNTLRHHLPIEIEPTAKETDLLELKKEAHRYALEKLAEALKDPSLPTAETSAVMLQYQHILNTLKNSKLSIRSLTKAYNDSDAILNQGYLMELERIQTLYEEEKICRATAARLRTNVSLMRMDIQGII